jgi:hypothetical protein
MGMQISSEIESVSANDRTSASRANGEQETKQATAVTGYGSQYCSKRSDGLGLGVDADARASCGAETKMPRGMCTQGRETTVTRESMEQVHPRNEQSAVTPHSAVSRESTTPRGVGAARAAGNQRELGSNLFLDPLVSAEIPPPVQHTRVLGGPQHVLPNAHTPAKSNDGSEYSHDNGITTGDRVSPDQANVESPLMTASKFRPSYTSTPTEADLRDVFRKRRTVTKVAISERSSKGVAVDDAMLNESIVASSPLGSKNPNVIQCS